MNAHIFGEISALSGPLDIHISASNLKFEAPFSLSNGNLLLRDTLKAEITLTQEVSETFLVDVYPLLIEAARSDHPLRLNIASAGFFLPLRPFAFERMQASSVIIDIGEIFVKNGGQLQKLIDFLKIKNITHSGVMSAWFTPIYMSLQNGIVTYKRFDMLLAHTAHLASWGQINQIHETVNMVLAISAATLKNRLGIQGLEKENMFQIRLRGKIDNVDVDWSSAYSRMAIVIAKTAGPPGLIIGSLLELLGGNLGEEPTPPPTTSPLPWKGRAKAVSILESSQYKDLGE